MGAGTELAPGTILSGTYEIVRRIGAGGMGAVYEAKHLRLSGRRVAVKVLLGDFARDAETFARFRREAEIGARIGHPNIIVVTDWDKLPDGSPFMVMEMLDGEDLDKRLNRERLTPAKIADVVREIGSALSAAHKQGIVHRDLKPHNIFLTPIEEADGVIDRVKVLDFGISKIAASQTVKTQESSILGTPQYMAPEQALGKSDQIDARTDQFALATIVYEMYAGRPAFKADSLTAVLFKVVYEAPPSLREVAPEAPLHVVVAVEKAMNKDRAARFPDVGAFVHALLSAEGGTSSDTVKDRAPVGRRLGAWVLAAAALLLLLGGGGVLAIRSMRDRPTPTKFTFPDPPPATATTPPPTTTPAPTTTTPAPTATTPPPATVTPPPTTTPPPTAAEKPAATKPTPTTGEKSGAFVASNPSTSKPAAAPAENPKVTPMLDEAQKLLDDKKWELSRVRATQSLGHQDTPRARRLIFFSYCGQQDLGGARSAIGRVSDKKPAEKRCRSLFPDY